MGRSTTADETPAETTPATEQPTPEAAADVTAEGQSEWVFITHKDDAKDVQPGRVKRTAFDKKWSAKGFQIVDPTKTGTEASSSE